MKHNPPDLLSMLAGLIGTPSVSSVSHDLDQGNRAVIDLLAEEASLVLRRGDGAAIQVDQYGRANRRGEETLLVPIFAENDALSHDLLDLLLGKVCP